jgi:hypothetical protein
VTVTRVVLILFGVIIGGYGALLLWENPPVIIMRILVWAVVGVVLHDLVFAPLCVALGFAARRLIPGRWWSPVALAAFCSVVLVFLAIPVYGKPGLRPDNLTVLDRNYPLGLLLSLAIVWACVPLYYLAVRLLPVRQNEVVQQQRADDVDRQPPTVRSGGQQRGAGGEPHRERQPDALGFGLAQHAQVGEEDGEKRAEDH